MQIEPNLKYSANLLSRILIVLLVANFIIVGVQYQVRYATPWSPPSEDALSELSWIRDHYGYDNKSIIIITRDLSFYMWALYKVGGLIYFGNLFYFLTNKTDYSLLKNNNIALRDAYIASLQKLWSYGILSISNKSSNLTILVPYHAYYPDPIEALVLKPKENGIFIVKPIKEDELKVLFTLHEEYSSKRDILSLVLKSNLYNNVTRLEKMLLPTNWEIYSGNLNSISIRSDVGIKDFNSSLKVKITINKEATWYLKFNNKNSLGLENSKYIGFYFKGVANTTGKYALVIILGNDFNSYLYYVFDQSIWNGEVNGILLPISAFSIRGNPEIREIRSIFIGIYSEQGGYFTFNFEPIILLG